MKKIKIDKELCSGHGRCYVLAPEIFTDDEAGFGQVIGDGSIDALNLDAAERAVKACPEKAIGIEGDTLPA